MKTCDMNDRQQLGSSGQAATSLEQESSAQIARRTDTKPMPPARFS
jgi:hypothetical protein